MSDISAASVMALRQKTGVSMMECKKALTEANGDEEKAIEILRKRGAMKASGKADRETAEGVVAISGKAIISIKCETDFVALNDDFVNFAAAIADTANSTGKEAAQKKFEEEKTEKITQLGENIVLGEITILEAPVLGGYVHSNRKVGALVGLSGGTPEMAAGIAMHATAMNPSVLSPDEVSEEAVSKEKEIWRDQLEKEGKPENIRENIMQGKEKKFREESALLKQAFVREPEKTIEEYAKNGGATVTAFARVAV